MEKQVLITVDSIIDDAAGESDKMSLVTEGRLTRVDDGYTVTYEESEITGLDGTTTTLRVNKDSVTLIRQGNVDAIMLFEAGKTHLTDYSTDNGNITLGITTRNIDISLGDRGGNIKVDYILEYDRAYGGRNRLNINVSEKKN